MRTIPGMNPRSTKQKPPSWLGSKPRRRLLLLSLGILSPGLLSPGLLSLAHAQDWPQWRGPNGDAHVAGFAAPAAWPKELAKKWAVEVGIGHSSPLIIGNRAFQFARQGENEVTRCLDLAT